MDDETDIDLLLPTLEGPAPCDDCANLDVCKTGAACFDFIQFVLDGSLSHIDRNPELRIFLAIYDQNAPKVRRKR